MGKIRVLHCPEMVAGNPQQLARAERELGIERWVVALIPRLALMRTIL
jgi:hypothetical protein